MVETDFVVYEMEQGTYVSPLPLDHVAKYGLAPQAIVGQVTGATEAAGALTPETFVANGIFHEFLHGVVERHAPTTPSFADDARRQRDGWIYVIDQRTPNPGGRVPPEDVIGGFEVRAGHVVAHSYQPIPAHRLMTERGFFQLGSELEQCLRSELEQLRAS